MKQIAFLFLFIFLVMGVVAAFEPDNCTTTVISSSTACDSYNLGLRVDCIPVLNTSWSVVYLKFNNTNGSTAAIGSFSSPTDCWSTTSFIQVYVNANNTWKWNITSMNGTDYWGAAINQTHCRTHWINYSSTQFGQKALCNATDGNCTFFLTAWAGAAKFNSSNYTMPANWSSTLFGSCAVPYVKREAFRNTTTSWVDLAVQDCPASMTWFCKINATSAYSAINKTTTNNSYAATSTTTFTVPYEVANTSEQFGSAVCYLSNGTELDFSSASPSTWVWGWNTEAWRIANLAGKTDAITMSPSVSWARQASTGFQFRVVSNYDGTGHNGVYYATYDVDYNASICTMQLNSTGQPINPADADMHYTVDFTSFGSLPNNVLVCNETTTVNVSVSVYASQTAYALGDTPVAILTNYPVLFEATKWTIDNVQAYNNSGTYDFWATISNKYTRQPIPAAANLSCNLTFNSTETEAVIVSDYDYNGNLTFTHLSFDTNESVDAFTTYPLWTIACDAVGYNTSGTTFGVLTKPSQHLTRIFRCMKANGWTTYYLEDNPTGTITEGYYCLVQGALTADNKRLALLSTPDDAYDGTTILAFDFDMNPANGGGRNPYINGGAGGGRGVWNYMMYTSNYPFPPGSIYVNKIDNVKLRYIVDDAFSQFHESNYSKNVADLLVQNWTDDYPELRSSAAVDIMVLRKPGVQVGNPTMVIVNVAGNETNYTRIIQPVIGPNNSVRCSLPVYGLSGQQVFLELLTEKGVKCGSGVYPLSINATNSTEQLTVYSQVVENIGGDNSYCNSKLLMDEAYRGTFLICRATVRYSDGAGEMRTVVKQASLPLVFSSTALNESQQNQTSGGLGGIFGVGGGWLSSMIIGLITWFTDNPLNALGLVLFAALGIVLMPVIIVVFRGSGGKG